MVPWIQADFSKLCWTVANVVDCARTIYATISHVAPVQAVASCGASLATLHCGGCFNFSCFWSLKTGKIRPLVQKILVAGRVTQVVASCRSFWMADSAGMKNWSVKAGGRLRQVLLYVLSSSRHLVTPLIYLRFAFDLGSLSIAGGWRKCGTLLIFCQTLSSYRLNEVKEIRTLVHYPSRYLKNFSLPCCLATVIFFLILLFLGCACAQQVIFFSLHWRKVATHPPEPFSGALHVLSCWSGVRCSG